MLDGIFGLIATFGYGVVFLVVMSESAGLPVPGETSLLLASALAATGRLNIVGVIVAAALGAILGDTGGYWVGRTWGVEKTVFFGRFVPVGRIFSAVLAGVGRMHYLRFLAWNASGGIVWATLMGTLGYIFGHNLPLIQNVVQKGGLALLAALILLVVVRILYGRRRQIAARWARFVALPALRVGRWTLRPTVALAGGLATLALALAVGGVVALTLM